MLCAMFPAPTSAMPVFFILLLKKKSSKINAQNYAAA
jgi:hypothetical protein